MTKQKNVLIIMSDEQRVDSLGCYGNQQARTPYLDKLAANGARFRHCVTPYPLCCPARSSLWTGTLPHQHHVVANWFHIREELRDTGMIHDFSAAGYQTLYVGKWHVPGTTPKRLGFSRWAAIPAVLNGCDRGRYIEDYRAFATARGYDLLPNMIENLTANDIKQRINDGPVHCGTAEIKLEDYLETWQTNQLLDQMEQLAPDQPFFTVCSYNAPHFPMIVPEPYDRLIPPQDVVLPANRGKGIAGKPAEVLQSEDYQHTKDFTEQQWRELTAHYWGFCALVDDQVGRIVRWLKEHGQYENTIIVYLSDHGDMLGSHNLNHKSGLMQYEETNLVPLIISGPGIEGGQDRDMLVSLADVMPTLAELCEIPIATPAYGRSFAAPLLDGKDSFRTHVVSEGFARCHSGTGTYEDPRQYTLEQNRPFVFAVRTEKDKYIFHQEDIEEYYDLQNDPGENENLASAPQVQARLMQLRRLMLKQLEDIPSLHKIVCHQLDAAGVLPS